MTENLIKKYILKNDCIEAEITNVGAALVSLKVNDCDGKKRDVILGYDDLMKYTSNTVYFGAILGRMAGEIRPAEVIWNGRKVDLPKDENGMNLHGGADGISFKVWNTEQADDSVVRLSVLSTEKQSGYPGDVDFTAEYRLDGNALCLEYSASAAAATPVNMTAHPYFNLNGHEHGDVSDHVLCIDADKYSITGGDDLAKGTVFFCADEAELDFRSAKAIGDREYDLNYVLNKRSEYDAVLYSTESGIRMRVKCSVPCLQCYNACETDEIGKGDAAFAECDKLSSVTIAEGFLNLSGALFSQCSALTSVVLPESLVYIDSNAFCRTGLTDIRIPQNVFFIDGSAFQECRMLKNVTLDANNANFILRSGVIYTADAKTIVLGIPAMMDENFVVPGTVESIQSRAFFGNGQLRSVYIPSSVKLIAREAFSDCSNLTSIFMEDGCTTLEYCCFGMQGGGGRETTVRLASTVSNLEYGVLCGRPIKSFAMPFESKALPSWACGTPSTIYTHRNVHELGIIPYAYEVTVYGYTGSAAEKWAQENDAEFIPYTPKELACITIKPGEKLALAGFGEHYAARWYSTDERIASISDNGVLTAISNGKCVIEGEVETKNGTIEVYTGIVSVSQEESPALPAGLNVLGAHAFEGCALTEIHIPSGMKEIPDGAFANNPYLAYVYIPNTVDHIADNAFSGCSGSITIVAPKDSKAHLFAVSRGLRFMLLK